jgi:membrane associated rhomboid family serine protease
LFTRPAKVGTGFAGLPQEHRPPISRRAAEGFSLKDASEPMFNVPRVVGALIALFVLVHFVREYVLSPAADQDFLVLFAFIPARYDAALRLSGPPPGGLGADVWTFVTYAFIHGDWVHLALNSVWLLPFGSAVARRFGPARFLAFFAVTAAAGALAFLITNPGVLQIVIGASGAISGTMAAAIRFAFRPTGSVLISGLNDERAYRRPAAPLSVVLRDPRVLTILFIWLGLDALAGITSTSLLGVDRPIAWQAHLGGFLAGLILFVLFDPSRRPVDEEPETLPD